MQEVNLFARRILCDIIITDISDGVDGVAAPAICVKRGVLREELACKLLILDGKNTIVGLNGPIRANRISVWMVNKVTRCHGRVANVDTRAGTHPSVAILRSFADETKSATSPRMDALSFMLEGSFWPDAERRPIRTSGIS